jgi:hypothetical protein
MRRLVLTTLCALAVFGCKTSGDTDSDPAGLPNGPGLGEVSPPKTSCEEVRDTSCKTFPEQVQIVGQVIAIEPNKTNGIEECKVTVATTFTSNHAVCPYPFAGTNVDYIQCGVCPEVDTEVSGVIMRTRDGLALLDR